MGGSDDESGWKKAGRAVGAFLEALNENNQEKSTGDSWPTDDMKPQREQRDTQKHREEVKDRRRSSLPEHRRENVDRQKHGKNTGRPNNQNSIENIDEWMDEIDPNAEPSDNSGGFSANSSGVSQGSSSGSADGGSWTPDEEEGNGGD